MLRGSTRGIGSGSDDRSGGLTGAPSFDEAADGGFAPGFGAVPQADTRTAISSK
ncbi:MAG: hypothetical protein Q7U07_00600 [Gammaproteobacteria bacterium]|nr:hypothetical protein [Gammaproteobacteria bacterium]